jgi:hypothetical protein
VYPGQILYLWSPTGELAPFVSGYTGDITVLVPTPPTWYIDFSAVNPYVMAFTVTASEEWVIGESYYATWTDPVTSATLRFTVTAAAGPNNPYLIPPAESFSDVTSAQSYLQDAINAGYSPIFLSPGDYPISSAIDVTGPYAAALVVIDGQNFASLTATVALGTTAMFNVGTSLTLSRLSLFGSIPDLSQSVLGSTSPQYVDIKVLHSRLEDISLGGGYIPNYDPDHGAYDAYTTGVEISRCEFTRASTGALPTGAAVNFCRFMETPQNSGAHMFFNFYSQKWLAASCDWVRTPRGIVLQSFGGGLVKNGVVAACRFWQIAQGLINGGEVINLECGLGYTDSIVNNIFIWSHAYTCSGVGVVLARSSSGIVEPGFV